MLKVIEEPSLHQILTHIEKKRAEMIGIGQCEGLTDTETIKCSKELDKLIFYYQLCTLEP